MSAAQGRSGAQAPPPPRPAPPLPGPAEALAAVVAAARAADVAVVVVGATEGAESEGFYRMSLRLPAPQDELVAAIARANRRTVAVVNSGGPVELPWRDAVGAVLLTWFPGQEGGHALADVLLGRAEPGRAAPHHLAGHLRRRPRTLHAAR
ncbi:glycoside hydrolase family 3 protein [Streptomyces sp. 5.8]|uniref:glycoside hydrolase family 3 protein n=1 Tax=Streptomyces sp. 5.8 TaxID=3406571 RepID=UPI003BB527AE